MRNSAACDSRYSSDILILAFSRMGFRSAAAVVESKCAVRLLRTMAAEGKSRELVDQIDAIRTKFDESCDIFGPVSAAEESMIEQLRGEISQRTAESERMRASIEQQRIQWTQHDANVQQLQEAMKQRDSDCQRLAAELSAASEQMAALHMLFKESEADRAQKSKQRQQLREELAGIYKSRSWRMTKPLRALSLLLRGNGASTQRE